MDDRDARIRARLIALADRATQEQPAALSEAQLRLRGRTRSALPIGALALMAVLAAAVVVLPRLGAQGSSGLPAGPVSPLPSGGPVSPLPSGGLSSPLPSGGLSSPLPSGGLSSPLPSGGISQERAIGLARQQSNADVQTLVSAVVGPFKDLKVGLDPGFGIGADRLVWAVTLGGTAMVCPPGMDPAGWSTCWPARAGTMTYYFDYYTGAFLGGTGAFLPPSLTTPAPTLTSAT